MVTLVYPLEYYTTPLLKLFCNILMVNVLTRYGKISLDLSSLHSMRATRLPLYCLCFILSDYYIL